MNNISYYILLIISILMSSYSQILLKKGTKKKNIYINFCTITGYLFMIISTLFSLLAYKKVALSFGQVLQSISFVFVSLLSYFILKEKIGKKSIFGIIIIIIGIIIYSF